MLRRTTHIALLTAMAYLIGHSMLPHNHFDQGGRTFITWRSNPPNIIQLIENALSGNIGFEHLKVYSKARPLILLNSNTIGSDRTFAGHNYSVQVDIWSSPESVLLSMVRKIFPQLSCHVITSPRGPPIIHLLNLF